MKNKILLDHHLAFLSLHRGQLESTPNLHLISSDKASFNIAFPLSKNSTEKIDGSYHIYLPDWSEAIVPKGGWQQTSKLAYMHLVGDPSEWRTNNKVEIRQAKNLSSIEIFSFVQAKGFSETEAEFDEWHPWLHAKNVENQFHSNQHFYIGYLNGKPAGVCLTIHIKNLLGIYAVTTLPEFRRKGVSVSIMKKAVADAMSTGIDGVTLQVFSGTYAERFYKELGFEIAFSCDIYRYKTEK